MTQAPAPPTVSPLGAPCVLIVDDVAENRDLLTRRLRSRGYRTVEAAGGLEALEKIGQEAFDIVLLDMMMPDLDGMQVLRRIREKYSLADLPVIMIPRGCRPRRWSARSPPTPTIRTKPIDFDVVLARIHTQLRRKQADEGVRRANQDLERQMAECAWRRAARRPGQQLLADMGHELRTPLNAIIGFAETLAGTELEPKQQEMVRIIGDSAETLERLLSDMLDQARAGAGRPEIKGEPFALGEAIRSVTDLWAARAAEKGIGFEVALPAEADADAHGDCVRRSRS